MLHIGHISAADQCTEVCFASFLSGGFITAIVVNPPTIYSVTTFLESCRKVVREKWFEKSGSRNLIREKWLTRKKGGFIV